VRGHELAFAEPGQEPQAPVRVDEHRRARPQPGFSWLLL